MRRLVTLRASPSRNRATYFCGKAFDVGLRHSRGDRLIHELQKIVQQKLLVVLLCLYYLEVIYFWSQYNKLYNLIVIALVL